MNGKDIFRDLKKGYKPQLNGFDLENRAIFSVNVGQKLPVYNIETVPGTKIRINPAAIMQSINPFQTKASIRLRQTLDFYFFPNNYSNTMFNQMIAGRKDVYLRSQINHDLAVCSFELSYFLERVLAHYGACFYCASDGADKMSPSSNKRMCEYGHLTISPSSNLYADVIRSLDLLGYGNYYPLLNAIETEVKTYTNNLGYAGAFAKLFVPLAIDKPSYVKELVRQATNLDVFKYPLEEGFFPDYADDEAWDVKQYNLFAPAAYNRVFDAYIRNSYFTEKLSLFVYNEDNVASDTSIIDFDFAELFNFDGLTKLHASDDREFYNLCAIFAIKPAARFKDMFTGILPDSQFGDVSVMMDNRAWLGLEIKTGDTYYAGDTVNLEARDIDIALDHPSGTISNVVVTSNDKYRFNPALAISVLEQRRANALQLFRERQMRAGNRTGDNFRAHFGEDPYSNTDMLPTYLGSYEGDVLINDVTSTADSGDAALGSRASYGTGVLNGNTIEMESKDFGTIIGILSIVPYDDYNSFMIDKSHTKLEQFDFFFPEFDDLGLQAASIDDFSIYGYRGSSIWNQNVIRGYLFRYYEHKLRTDKVHGAFYRGFYCRYDPSSLGTHISSIPANGGLSHYVAARPSLDPTEESFLYCQINDLDSVFGFAASFDQQFDQFFYNINFNAPTLQPMSVLGLPY